jgi:hypothetical protein
MLESAVGRKDVEGVVAPWSEGLGCVGGRTAVEKRRARGGRGDRQSRESGGDGDGKPDDELSHRNSFTVDVPTYLAAEEGVLPPRIGVLQVTPMRDPGHEAQG